MQSYAVIDDIYQRAISARAFIAYARPFDAVDATTGTIRLKAHGFSPLDIIGFEVTSGGVLPSQLAAFVPFYPLPVSSDLFRVSLSPNGAPIASFNVAGSAWAISLDPIRRLNDNLVDTAAIIDEHLTAHDPPIERDALGNYPSVLVGVNARMAARRALNTLQVENAEYRVAIDQLFALQAMDDQMLAAWLKGKPMQPRPIDGNLTADNAAFAVSSTPIDWSTGVL